MSKLYIISGCNGTGKTTASYTALRSFHSNLSRLVQYMTNNTMSPSLQTKRSAAICLARDCFVVPPRNDGVDSVIANGTK